MCAQRLLILFFRFRCSSLLQPPPLIHTLTHAHYTTLITLTHSNPLYSHTRSHTQARMNYIQTFAPLHTQSHSYTLVTIAHSDLTSPSLTSSVSHTHFHTLTLLSHPLTFTLSPRQIPLCVPQCVTAATLYGVSQPLSMPPPRLAGSVRRELPWLSEAEARVDPHSTPTGHHPQNNVSE